MNVRKNTWMKGKNLILTAPDPLWQYETTNGQAVEG